MVQLTEHMASKRKLEETSTRIGEEAGWSD